MPETQAEYPADLPNIFHRYAVCRRDYLARITKLGGNYFGPLAVDDIVEVIVEDEDCAIVTGGRALLHSLGDDWTVAA